MDPLKPFILSGIPVSIAAKLLNLTHQRVRQLIALRHLHAVSTGRDWLISPLSLRSALALRNLTPLSVPHPPAPPSPFPSSPSSSTTPSDTSQPPTLA